MPQLKTLRALTKTCATEKINIFKKKEKEVGVKSGQQQKKHKFLKPINGLDILALGAGVLFPPLCLSEARRGGDTGKVVTGSPQLSSPL